MKEYLKKLGIIPQYTEISLFLMGLTVLFIVISNFPYFEAYILKSFQNLPRLKITLDLISGVIFVPFIILAWIYGWFLSIYYAFSEKQMTKNDKRMILNFIIPTTAITGMIASIHILKESKGVWIIFPFFNFFSAYLLAKLYEADIITTTDVIIEKQAKREEVVIGTIAVFIIFFISNYILKNHWSITFSICTSYAALFNEMITKLFFKHGSTKI
jgi:hypothetical protein